jgi:DNA-binding SARP family transcriptional activator
MQVALLGELKVLDDHEREVVVTGAKLRALLVVLALQAGRAVPADQLVEALWGDEPPSAVRNGLQGLVSKLRRALGPTSVVAMRGGGYALELAPNAVDAHRFEQLVAQGRAAAASGSATLAIELLAEADSMWRGDALAEFAYEEFASAEITRLSELRVAAVEERLELELELGRHQGVIGELEELVGSHPLRERPRRLLMVALYRAGRQADALRVFQDVRRGRSRSGCEPTSSSSSPITP